MLTLREPPRSVWERFVAGVATHDDPPLVARWCRAFEAGATATGAAGPVGVSDSELALRRDRLDEGAAGATALLSTLCGGLAQRGFMSLFSDAEGVNVHAQAAEGFDTRAARARLTPGARWSEGDRGTNAIGTAAFERRAIAVVGRGHLEERNHGLVCYAAPVFDAHGALFGVLDATSHVEAADDMVAVAVESMAAAIELQVRARALHAASPAWRRRVVEQGARGRAVFLLEAPGVVRAMSAAAVARLTARGAREGVATTDALFGMDWPSLQRASLDAAGARATQGDRLHLEPMIDGAGRVVAVMAVVEGERAARATTREARAVVRAEAPVDKAFSTVTGSDPAVIEARQMATRFARSRMPVLLLAETGTGKELMARAIHAASDRRDRAFVAINCGALAPSVLESELFGYAPGAFTGARASGQSGKIAAADGGTLFLDEIAELPLDQQAVLLRVLEDGSFSRVGSTREERADVRLVCATCRDLGALVKSRAFRNDLYFRIKGVALGLPPLRARSDLDELAQAILVGLARHEGRRAAPTLSPEALGVLRAHDWPGNVRELKTALHHAVVMAGEDAVIEPEHLPRDIQQEAPSAPETGSRLGAERSALDRAIRATAGNLSEAARRLGVARSTFYRMLRRHGMDVTVEASGKPKR